MFASVKSPFAGCEFVNGLCETGAHSGKLIMCRGGVMKLVYIADLKSAGS